MRYKITCFLLGCASVAVLFCIAIVAHSHGFHINREIDIFGMLEALATIVSLVSIWIVIFQFHAEHEKNRREKTVDVLIEWGKSINQNTYGIKKLCEQLDETQCRHLIHLESFKVDSQWYQEFCQIFYPDRPLTDVSDKLVYPKSIYCDNCTSEYSLVELKKSEVLKLRWEVTNYLNVVEFVLIAWEGKVVDTEVIEQEFDFLIDRKNGKTLLEVFRMVAGDEETYPAIKAFCLNAARKKEDKLLKRTQVDQLDK